MTLEGVRNLLLREVRKAGSAEALAAKHGITSQYVRDVMASRKAPGPSILKGLGVKKIVTYKRINGGPNGHTREEED